MKNIERIVIYGALIFLSCLQIGNFNRFDAVDNDLCMKNKHINELFVDYCHLKGDFDNETTSLWNHHQALYKITQDMYGEAHKNDR